MSKSKSESGNAVNIQHFKMVIDTCTSFGDDYDPSNEDLVLPTMTKQWTDADKKEKAYQAAVQGTRKPVGDRQALFQPLDPLVTRVMGELDSSKASAHLKDLARSLANDIRGMNIKKAPPDSADPTAELDHVSQSHQSFVNKAKNFYSLIELLKTIPEFKPKKEDLTIEGLTELYNKLNDANNGLEPQLLLAKKAGIAVTAFLYAPETGLVETAAACKAYVKGLYGAGSANFKLVNGIRFKNLGKDE